MPRSEKTFSLGAARRYYDRFGAGLDSQVFYEQPALQDLAAHLSLPQARHVLEFGCGTGGFAETLLSRQLSPDAHYLGLDASATMAALAAKRLERFGARARVMQSDGTMQITAADGACDRIIVTYVMDILPEDQIRALLCEAGRALMPGGLLGATVLSPRPRGAAVLVTGLWKAAFRLSPWLTGGCRPIDLGAFINNREWRVIWRNTLAPFAVSSDILVLQKNH